MCSASASQSPSSSQPVFCILCALRAFVYMDCRLGQVLHDESLVEHILRVHPDPFAAAEERSDLQVAVMRMLGIRRVDRGDWDRRSERRGVGN